MQVERKDFFMKSKKALIILGAIMFFVMIFNTVGLVLDTFFYTVDDVPTGEFVAAYSSPYGDAKINVYVVKNPIANAVRCEVVSGEKTRSFYWEVGADKASVTWLDKEIVYINGRTLDINKSEYDSRSINDRLDKHLEERYTVYQ